MAVSFLLIVFLAIVLLVVIYLTRKHWRIYGVLGAVVLGALVIYLALVGCGTNTIEPLRSGMTVFHDDCQYSIHFETTKPFEANPIAEYTLTKNTKGDNDVVLSVLKRTTETPKPGVHRATVIMTDNRHFEVRIPLEESDYPANFFLGRKLLHRVAITPVKEIPVSETEEGQE